MKILNLYAGIGGNRKLWGDEHEITAVEYDENIAAIYQEFFPNDKVIVTDAHEYLLNHYDEYDFIWSSPPCQSHSGCNHFLKGQGIIRYPDMSLYQEIILLQTHFKGGWVVENVKPYYKALIPAQEAGRHLFWANFIIKDIEVDYPQIGTMNRSASKETQRKAIIREAQIPELLDLHGLKNFKIKNKRQVLRNCVLPKVGEHVLNSFLRQNPGELFV
jgi:DNA (cytosine-5)-methyltransferase 1